MSRIKLALLFLLIAATVICGVVVVDAAADKLEQRAEPVGITDELEQTAAKELSWISEQLDEEPIYYEDPQESEKIEAALDWHYIEDCTLTAYCACAECCGKSDGITATGTVAQEGVTIAVDPDVIPLGSWVEIEGIDGQFHAEDVGAFSGNHIDIYIADHNEAWDFGRQYADVRWYKGL